MGKPPLTSFVLREVNALGEDGTFDGPIDVAVAGDRIVDVQQQALCEGAVDIDCAGLFVMPGAIDCHTHLMATTTDALQMLQTPFTLRVLEGAEMALRTLCAGITYARDAGGADAGLRDALARGLVPGPGLQVAVALLSRTGGHADGYLRGAGLEFAIDYRPMGGRVDYLVDGVESMRIVVRRLLRDGADWIKLCATGGIASEFDDPLAGELTTEEIQIAVAEAAVRGKRVMVHAYGGDGLTSAIAAGVASIEHGTLLTEEQAQAMSASGTWLVPTIAILEDDLEQARKGHFPPHIAGKALAIEPHLRDVVLIAHEFGVPIAAGSDAVRRDLHGGNLSEIAALRRAGLPARHCLRAATVSAAELLGLDRERGSLAPGKVADLLVLDEDPSDCSVFVTPSAVTGVIQAGEVRVPHPRLEGLYGALPRRPPDAASEVLPSRTTSPDS